MTDAEMRARKTDSRSQAGTAKALEPQTELLLSPTAREDRLQGAPAVCVPPGPFLTDAVWIPKARSHGQENGACSLSQPFGLGGKVFPVAIALPALSLPWRC